ncbi:MAG: hypothetical protein V3U23_02605 [Kiloniellales bacterium]
MRNIWRSELDDSDVGDASTPDMELPAENDRAVTHLAGLVEGPKAVPEIATRRSAATSYGDLAAIIRLQSTELERLALENERLMARLEAFFRFHENEQKRHRDLQERIERLSQDGAPRTRALDVDEFRREVCASMTEEIKPVLAAILDLLERSLQQPDREPVAEPAPAIRNPLPVDEFLRLPEILTRPLEELVTPLGEAAESEPNRARAARAEPARHHGQTRSSELPGIFAWTNFSA